MDENKVFIALVLSMLAVFLFVVSVVKSLDLLNHWRRYRKYLLEYPSTHIMKGRVWKATR